MFKINKNKRWSVSITVIAAYLVAMGIAQASTVWLGQAKLLALDGEEGDEFGCCVFIGGDFAIVAARSDDDKGSNCGCAYIFKRVGTDWVQQAKLIASDGVAGDYFGISVSASGDFAIVGAYHDDDNGDESGSAYIFKRDGTDWVQQQKILASDGAAEDLFGHSVSISGDFAIVGAYHDDDNGNESGSAYIFKRDGTDWVQQQKILASDGAAGDRFGYSVSISGDFAIVGAHLDDDNGSASGSAYIFKWDGTSWVQQQKILASDGEAYERFGRAVSISGDYVIVAAHLDDDNGSASGSAYIFKRDGTDWIQQAKLLALDGAAYDYFGKSVFINGDFAIVGAYGKDDNGSNCGCAYIFKRYGTDWIQQAKLLASDGAAEDLFGFSVSISGDYCIAGAYGDDDNGGNSGSAYIFGRVCPEADLSGDCRVDFVDLAILSSQWLQDWN